jgi:predicted small lipoprotein YifL
MTHRRLNAIVGIVLLFTIEACERQGPPPKPIGAATNKHAEEAPAATSRQDADAMIQHMKTPMENARRTEDLLKESADRTRQQADQTTP